MSERNLHNYESQTLAELMGISVDSTEGWGPDDLGDILSHQWTVPLVDDLEDFASDISDGLQNLCSSQKPPVKTWRDLLHHPCPPVEILVATKRFAKQCGVEKCGPLPAEIAAVLYLVSISVAEVRCNRQITEVDDQTVIEKLRWAMSQTWLESDIRHLFAATIAHLESRQTP